jgi:hypothetical protein
MNNIYRMNAAFDTTGLPLKSVYIPSIHRHYDVTTICYVFLMSFGIVCRIDRVEKTVPERDFQSAFVYYYETAHSQNTRIYPSKYAPNRHSMRRSPIGQNEFWVLLPNKKMFPDTTLTLDEISQGFDRMEQDADDDELAILSENREYLRELRYAQNTPCYYLDTSINIHQVAQNLLLMEDRFAVKDAKNYRFEVGGTTLFVENIPTEFGEEDLWSHFSKLQSGLICAKVCRNPRTKESMGFGYVCFDEGVAISNPVWASFKISAVSA